MRPVDKLRKFIIESGDTGGITFASERAPVGPQVLALTVRDARWLVEHIDTLERALSQPTLKSTGARLAAVPLVPPTEPDEGGAA